MDDNYTKTRKRLEDLQNNPNREAKKAANEIYREYLNASEKFGPFHGPHEGWAIIKKEMDELWEVIRDYPKADKTNLRKEAMQIGAMALRFMIDICSD